LDGEFQITLGLNSLHSFDSKMIKYKSYEKLFKVNDKQISEQL